MPFEGCQQFKIRFDEIEFFFQETIIKIIKKPPFHMNPMKVHHFVVVFSAFLLYYDQNFKN